jgi:hypothetical protein
MVRRWLEKIFGPIHKAGHNDWPSQITVRPAPPQPMNRKPSVCDESDTEA